MNPDVSNTSVVSLFYPLVKLVAIDVILALIAFLLIVTLARSKRAGFAVLKRNFYGYFSNPTGYVFLCLFVLLTSMAAFWPHEFFNSNLANLDQLNYWFPIIMLFFIPAITMSIWAEEKRQGTDELLLTLPADDFDIVIGKYLAAGAIYTVSLVFSQISTFLVLLFLSKGQVDTGLFVANYLGYWFIGLAMLAIGMIASFLTSNLTVGFILGALFNAPLAFAAMADVIIPEKQWAQFVSSFSINEQFDNFGRGVISIAPMAFFSLVVVLGIYFCMVLIGRRHWSGGKDGNVMFLHYLARIVLLTLIVFSASFFLRNNDSWLRKDLTEGQVSSLSPTTKRLIQSLQPERPIVIDAFISANIPEQYAKTRYDLVTLLKEFQALASSRNVKLQVQINQNLEPSGEEALLADKQYGITPQVVRVRERGAYRDQEVLLGAAVRSGLSKVVIPFFESGVPVEYELVRSINTVAQPRRSKLGIVQTDANFMGGFSMAGGFTQIPKQPIVEELEKQYDVEQVDPNSPISTEAYDVLFVAQPSSLNPQQLTNLVDAVKAGVPTAIFEDPMPAVYQGIPGTGEPKQPQGNPMMGGQPPEPKGEIQELWNVLGLKPPVQSSFSGINPDIVWQQYNPHPKLQYLMNANDEWLFILEDPDESSDYLSEESNISAGLRELMFLYAGAVEVDKDRDDLKFVELVKTRDNVSGRIGYEDISNTMRGRDVGAAQLQVLQGPPTGSQTVAVYVEGVSDASSAADDAAGDDAENAEAADDGETEAETDDSEPAPTERPIKAVYVADVDYMHPFFSENRKRPEQFEELDLRVQNITFVLNVVDVLAGEEDYPTIRSHEPRHITLGLFEDQAEIYRQEAFNEQKEFQQKFNEEKQAAEEEMQKKIAEFREKIEDITAKGPIDKQKRDQLLQYQQQLQVQEALETRKLAVKTQQMEIQRDAKVKESQRKSEAEVLKLQNRYKMLAIFLPPIPPLLVGAGVFVSRRVREREGIAKSRLR